MWIFLIHLLRSELFDPRKSASRFTKYIDLLFDLYGECALRRPIQLQDLNLEELTFLKSGQNQLLPYRDRSGRRILSIIVNNKEHVPFRVRVSLILEIHGNLGKLYYWDAPEVKWLYLRAPFISILSILSLSFSSNLKQNTKMYFL